MYFTKQNIHIKNYVMSVRQTGGDGFVEDSVSLSLFQARLKKKPDGSVALLLDWLIFGKSFTEEQ